MLMDADPAPERTPAYRPRIVDDELDELMSGLPALVIEGAKGVGKTATASRRAVTVHGLDDPQQRAIAKADPARLLGAHGTTLIDEWQHVPESWDLVRRAVDAGATPGRFLLTGSTTPAKSGTHSGAGRIVSVRMRPLALAERDSFAPSVSLRALLTGTKPTVAGHTEHRLEDYAKEIVTSGFPGLRGLGERALRAQLDGYLTRIVDRDFPELGHSIRNPVALERWMRAYAAASSTSASFEKIRDAASAGHAEKPAKSTTIPYRDALERLWIIDPVAAWLPSRNRIARLSSPPKHQLADPALAARLLGVGQDSLLSATPLGPSMPREGTLMGALFESLVTLSVRVYAQAAEARVRHLRTAAGVHEVDLIVERSNGGVLAIEVKLARDIDEHDTRHLKWLAEKIGTELLDAIVITTGQDAYRRSDGIAVIPAGLLGP
jgi:predicted AAA+ superfamily ATPase